MKIITIRFEMDGNDYAVSINANTTDEALRIFNDYYRPVFNTKVVITKTEENE